MKINTNDIRIGFVIEHEGKLWVVTKTQHTQPGKGGAYMQVEMKNLLEGTKTNERFRASDTVEKVHLEEVAHQYLYKEGTDFVFMNNESFEQLSLDASFVRDNAEFLRDNMDVDICFYDNTPISLKLPDHVTLEVREAEPVVKGQTATSSYKPAVLENGVKVMVPPHIEAGMRIVVNTVDKTYVERAKS